MVCEERIKLKEALDQADRVFDSARRDFNASMGVASLSDFEVLKRRGDLAWENLTRARSAWEAHVLEHACLKRPRNKTK